MDWQISGGQAFHRDPAQLHVGELCIEGGCIAAGAADGAQRLDASGCLVLPGFVIAHHHLYSALARGMPPPPQVPTNFAEVLGQVWWRLDRALDPELNELSACVGALESLRCGVTGIIDHHASPCAIAGSLTAVAAGVQRAGARAVLCYEASNRHGEGAFEAGLAENARWLAADKAPTLAAMVGGHAPFTLSDPQLNKLAALAAAHDVALHLHVAEAADDQIDARRLGAEHVTERLERSGILAGKALLAHGVQLSAAELVQLRDAGVWLSHQPRSNMNNHVGYLSRARSFGKRLALGTDGINGDIVAEAEVAFFRLREHDRHAAAETVWGWLANNWRLLSDAFGVPPERGFGCFAEGAPADIVVLDYPAPTP
ncbi:MAG TPA: ssnA protein, partial [Sorangium sp.]|nr:ssnA protein [Sorangium sp.]